MTDKERIERLERLVMVLFDCLTSGTRPTFETMKEIAKMRGGQ